MRESSVALCHRVPPPRSSSPFFCFRHFFARHRNAWYAGYHGPGKQCCSVPQGGVKKKDRFADRESGVALCHGVAFKRNWSVVESSIALCHGVALKKKKEDYTRNQSCTRVLTTVLAHWSFVGTATVNLVNTLVSTNTFSLPSEAASGWVKFIASTSRVLPQSSDHALPVFRTASWG